MNSYKLWSIRCQLLVTLCVAMAVATAQTPGLNMSSSDELLKLALKETRSMRYSQAMEYCRAAVKKAPADDDIHTLLGRLYFIAQDFDGARKEWTGVLRRQPRNKDVLQYLANLETNAGNRIQALQYVNTALNWYSDDKALLLRKYDLLWLSNADTQVLNKVLFLLQKKYGTDAKVQGLLSERYLGVANEKSRAGKWGESLPYLDSLLAISPGNADYLFKRSAAALSAGKYAEAIAGAEKLCALQHDARAYSHLEEVCMTAARNATGMQRIGYARRLLKWQPDNRVVLDFLVNNCYSQQLYDDALLYANLALQRFRSDTVFMKKKLGILMQQQYYGDAAVLADQLLQRKKDKSFAGEYADIYIAASDVYLQNGNIAAGEQVLKRGLTLLPANAVLLKKMSTVRNLQGDTATSLRLLDAVMAMRPDEQLQFEKAALLEAQGNYKEALMMTAALLKAHPDSRRYRQAYADQALAAARKALRGNDTASAAMYIDKVLEQQPGQQDALLYAINMAYAAGAFEKAIENCDRFLKYFPADSLVLVKKTGILAQQGRLTEAIITGVALQERYSNDGSLKAMCADTWFALGKFYQDHGNTDSAVYCYRQVLSYAGEDTLAIAKLVSCFAVSGKPDSVLVYVDKGLRLQPGYIPYLREKAAAFEKQKKYGDALKAIAAWKQYEPGNKRLDDYLLQVKGMQYRNQLGILHLQSFYDNGTRTALVSSLQYLRRFNKGVMLGRINYGDRQSGNGFQAEGEIYYNHHKKYYSWLWLGWSNSLVFPRYRASYSLYHNFSNGWEGEIGFRYLRADSINIYTPVVSVAKYAGNYWVNLRGFFNRDMNKWYQAYTLTNRFYINDQKDFAALLLGIGASPDDRSRNFMFGSLLGVTTTSITLGYQKSIRYRTVLSLYGSWNHMNFTGIPDVNQYDIYLSFYQNF